MHSWENFAESTRLRDEQKRSRNRFRCRVHQLMQDLRQRVQIVLGFLGVACVGLLLLDYFHTRSSATFALVLSRLGPDTPLESYEAEFGKPMHHFVDPDEMRSWGPRTDAALLSKTELYYFGYSGLPHRYVAVYVDKATHRSVLVTWKYM